MREAGRATNKELKAIKELFERETPLGRNFLLRQKEIVHSDYFLSRLLLNSAKFGSYDFSEVKLVGAALELLEVALKKHYDQSEDISTKANDRSNYDFKLITGDYYYAKAILLVESLGEFVVGTLARAIANFVGACAHHSSLGNLDEEFLPELRKIASLYEGSCILGCFLGKVPKKIAGSLVEFSSNIGVARILRQDRLPGINGEEGKTLTKHHFLMAEKALGMIREGEAAKELRGLIAFE